MSNRRIYLDNAATSWPKPEEVYAAVDDSMRRLGAPAGRGAYAEANEVNRGVEQTRSLLAKLIGATRADSISFALNCTDALNLAIHGILSAGDHVVTSVVEHNSILRPLRTQEERGVSVTRVSCSPEGVINSDDVRNAIRPETKLIALTHVSNVTGAAQPIADVGAIAREYDVPLLVDAAQSLGHLAIDVEEQPIDLLAASGHKGLLGPLGTGLLYTRPGLEERVRPLRQGGTGSLSEHDKQPIALPDRYESGNHNVPGILGLGAGVRYIIERGLPKLAAHESDLVARLTDGLRSINGVHVYGPTSGGERIGPVSFNLAGYDPQEAAAALEAAARVQVRAGLHCAPLMHKALGTLRRGGAVRASFGPFNETDDVDTLLDVVSEMVAAEPYS